MKKIATLAIVSAVLLLASAAQAGIVITRFEVNNVAQTLQTRTLGGHGGDVEVSNTMGYNTTTNRIHWVDTESSAYSFWWLDPTAYGDLGGSHASETGVARQYNASVDAYAGTVTGGTKIALANGGYGFAYVPETNSMFAKSSHGNGADIDEYQAARSVEGADVVGEGTVSDKTMSLRVLSEANPDLHTGDYHVGLAFLGSDATYYKFLTINRKGSTSQEGREFKLTKAYSIDPTTTAIGERTMAAEAGTVVVTAGELNGLVPGVDDFTKDIANDSTGNIWVISTPDGTTDTYLSAFSLDGGFSQIDLDGDTANLHVNLTGLIRNPADDANVAGRGIAVNGDASKVYISGYSGSTSTLDQIFIFDVVPEPATMGLLGLGFAGMAAMRRRRRRK